MQPTKPYCGFPTVSSVRMDHDSLCSQSAARLRQSSAFGMASLPPKCLLHPMLQECPGRKLLRLQAADGRAGMQGNIPRDGQYSLAAQTDSVSPVQTQNEGVRGNPVNAHAARLGTTPAVPSGCVESPQQRVSCTLICSNALLSQFPPPRRLQPVH